MLFIFVPALSEAAPVIKGDRIADKKDHVRFVLDIKNIKRYEVFILENPHRVVIDISKAEWDKSQNKIKDPKSRYIKSVRYGKPRPGVYRIVLDMKVPISVKEDFIIPPSKSHPHHRLVLDLKGKPGKQVAKKMDKVSKLKPEKVDPSLPASMQKKSKPKFLDKGEVVEKVKPIKPIIKPKTISRAKPKPKADKRNKREGKPVIVIDAGHGGIDPGAIGRSGIHEKDVTYKFASALKGRLEKTGKYKVVMTRKGDYFVNLRDRVAIAREAKSNLFISLHADSHPNPKTRGLSVYTLSEKASDKEAAALARKANYEDVIEGVDLKDEEDDLQKLLIDMVQRDTKNNSAEFAELLVRSLGQEAKLLKNTHRFAGFVVLTGADVPSVLVELGYLSNKTEESLLRKSSYRSKLVKSITEAIDKYFKKNDF